MKLIQNEIETFENRVCSHRDFKLAYEAINKLTAFRGRKPKGLFVFGETGSGKTCLAEYFEAKNYSDETDELSPIPIVYIDVALEKTTGQIISAMLQKMGDPTPYNDYENVRRNRAVDLLKSLNVKLVVFDEIQDLIPKKGIKPNSKVYVFIKHFLNSANVPFLLLGTPDAKELFADDQLFDRFLPAKELRTFSCIGVSHTTNFACMLDSLLDLMSRNVEALRFVEYQKDAKGQQLPILKKDINLLLRFCLATLGRMRRINALLTECIALTSPEKPITQQVLYDAFNEGLNNRGNYNPFHKDINIQTVKTSLKEKNLYEPIK